MPHGYTPKIAKADTISELNDCLQGTQLEIKDTIRFMTASKGLC